MTDLAREAAVLIAEHSGVARHDIALVLGSGWSAAAAALGEEIAHLDAAQLPGFRPSPVAGHAARVQSIAVASTGARALVLPRTHLYECHGAQAVAHAVRTAAAAGCRVVVLTNGCGGLRPEWAPGTPVLIADHINLTGATPLESASFVDLTDLYSARLRALARQVEPLDEGVYVQFRGPQYETPAEVRMARTLGGDLVGMSTSLEAIAAREAGLEVLGLSLVTNPAAGISPTPLNHQEVLQAGRDAAGHLAQLLAAIVERITVEN